MTTYQLPHSQPAGVRMLQKPTNSLLLLPARSSIHPRPLSDATEILDTDFEDEFSDVDSPRRSVESSKQLGHGSSTTLSTPDDLPTPSALETAFSLGLESSKPVQGPSGPHLFRASLDASVSGRQDDHDWQVSISPDTMDNVRTSAIVFNEKIFDNRPPVDDFRPGSGMSISRMSPHQDLADVYAWTPAQVAEWMYEAGLEDMVVERFIENDISGAVLLDLQIEDLKELDIQSFGKRHRLMNMIQNLRAGAPTNPNEISSPRVSRSASVRRGGSKDFTGHSPASDRDTSRQHRRNRVVSEKDVISPGESVSIVAIEQLIPKPHKCSKGENCPKYQRRQRRIARIAKEFPNEFAQVRDDLVSVKLSSPVKADNNGIRPQSDVTTSVVASSDVLGPSQMPELRLNAENLNGVQPRDPQENVRQFLSFQHIQHHIRPEDEQPALQMFPPLSPPVSSSTPAHIATQLHTLPRLVIPRSASVNAAYSPDRTITPYMGSRLMGSATATQETHPYQFDGHDVLRQVTPFSEVDAPVTAMPIDPLDRDVSQSVPPNMRYGTFQSPAADPIYRPQSVRPDYHRQRPSFATMEPLAEDRVLLPINSPSEFRPALTPLQPQPATLSHPTAELARPATGTPKDPDVSHSGWMKKRKTKLLRHEWHDAHFTLKGTVLAMHKDERDSRALETIDVDDYAVACSSLASSSKLTAAFKRSALKKAASLSQSGSHKGLDETAFAFSLVPTSGEKKSLFLGSKSHHFAVKTRDERINWMRELMLAKALKKGKEGGNEIGMNGNMI
ncbi:hypothetical protein LOZ12_006808 [Ophidiomyces ophidiicola]|nr:hypothetical protein LOZ64_006798 [Ophidiomyces ophidiicola]KAI1930986.1 hypothetical protein LOZ62_006825 [Ophidiomyces ophidiicola]KAI1970172.1 hypothetical protein LOZ55_006607 [Ophidiomyces ophidiicola]KAI1980370.1 hypothetical protein LOZ54_005847 [Ophidiomyces ophidiicola]KAI2003264.1 hypothetical protein LOZ51_000339 [Ophidiomyces ophidiicola]